MICPRCEGSMKVTFRVAMGDVETVSQWCVQCSSYVKQEFVGDRVLEVWEDWRSNAKQDK